MYWLCYISGGKELPRVLKPLIGKYSHHVNNTKEFTDEINNTKFEEGEYITSYDVTALFTSVPTLEIIKKRLEHDTYLPNRLIMTAADIIELLRFFLK